MQDIVGKENYFIEIQDHGLSEQRKISNLLIEIAQEIEAKIKGYEGEACGECGNFTLVRNGTCMKCNTCGATSGCS